MFSRALFTATALLGFPTVYAAPVSETENVLNYTGPLYKMTQEDHTALQNGTWIKPDNFPTINIPAGYTLDLGTKNLTKRSGNSEVRIWSNYNCEDQVVARVQNYGCQTACMNIDSPYGLSEEMLQQDNGSPSPYVQVWSQPNCVGSSQTQYIYGVDTCPNSGIGDLHSFIAYENC